MSLDPSFIGRAQHRSLLVAMMLLAGCSSAPTVQIAPPDATIVNNTARPLAEVRYRVCNDDGTTWSSLSGTALPPGQSTRVRLPEACVDLNAYTGDGKLVGTQRGIRREFPFRWVLY